MKKILFCTLLSILVTNTSFAAVSSSEKLQLINLQNVATSLLAELDNSIPTMICVSVGELNAHAFDLRSDNVGQNRTLALSTVIEIQAISSSLKTMCGDDKLIGKKIWFNYISEESEKIIDQTSKLLEID